MRDRNLSKATVRIWGTTPSEKLGHASVEIGNYNEEHADEHGISGSEGAYVSIFPRARGISYIDINGAPVTCRTLSADLEKYKNNNLQEVTLNSLNVPIMLNAYSSALPNLKFALPASSIFKAKGTANCTSLTYHLLVRGGLEDKLLTRIDRIRLRAQLNPNIKVLFVASFVLFLIASYSFYKLSRLYDKSMNQCISAAEQFDMLYPNSEEISGIKRVRLFDELYPAFAGFYRQCPVEYLNEIRKAGSMLLFRIDFRLLEAKEKYPPLLFIAAFMGLLVYTILVLTGFVMNSVRMTPSFLGDYVRRAKIKDANLCQTQVETGLNDDSAFDTSLTM